MTAFTEKLDRAAGAALCEGLTQAGGALIGAGAVSLAFGGAGLVPISFGAAALMAGAAGCTWDTEAGGGANDPPPEGLPCLKGSGLMSLKGYRNGNLLLQVDSIIEITKVEYRGFTNGVADGFTEDWDLTYVQEGGREGVFGWLFGTRDGTEFFSEQGFSEGSVCEIPVVIPPAPEIPPYEYTDPVDGCKLTVNLQGFATDDLGALNPVYKIEPAAELRADGGVIGGCNFSPVIYTGNPGGPGEPPIIRPWDPSWDLPTPGIPGWADFLREVAAGLTANAISDALNKIFAVPEPPSQWTLRSVCEVDAEGKPQTEIVEANIPALNGFQSVNQRIDTLIPFLQALKDFKQPTCPPVKAQGELRTIGFISEAFSPNGRDYLRKRLRYRSVSGIGLNDLINHWKDFQFDAGPVIVKHLGSSWGTVTVWAASADEGKRVIRHAAGEAGIDADSTGRWEISGSTSTRRGMPGKMRVNTSGGFYWITARDGSSERPMVGAL